MAFLRSPLPEDYLGPLIGPTLTLRPPAIADYPRWAELRSLSRAHLVPWEPGWARDELTRQSYRRRLRAYGHDARDDQGYSFFIVNGATDVLMGGLTLSNIRRGAAQIATLGYWIGAPFAGRGHMQEAVGIIVPFAFRALRLHRLEAASMTDNVASQHVLEKSGFLREGLARRYLKINGVWEDHLIYALIEEDAAAKGLLRGKLQ
jgi:ribosomal-protein-alanine N-acetyltransferase